MRIIFKLIFLRSLWGQYTQARLRGSAGKPPEAESFLLRLSKSEIAQFPALRIFRKFEIIQLATWFKNKKINRIFYSFWVIRKQSRLTQEVFTIFPFISKSIPNSFFNLNGRTPDSPGNLMIQNTMVVDGGWGVAPER